MKNSVETDFDNEDREKSRSRSRDLEAVVAKAGSRSSE